VIFGVRGPSIYRGREVRGLGYEGVVEETVSTIHAQELPPTYTNSFPTFNNCAIFMKPPRLKAETVLEISPKDLEVVLELLGFEKFISPFNVLQYPVLLLFSQHLDLEKNIINI